MNDMRRPHSWVWRRSMAFAVMAFSMGIITWLTWYGVQDGALHQMIGEGCIWLLAGVFLIYVGGATIDDLVSLVKGVRGIPENEKK